MESSKLKNIVLIILVITNLLLLLLLGFQRLEARRYENQTLSDAVELLTQQGIAVDRDALPAGAFPAPLTLERDLDWERQRFTDLLGEGATHTQRGLVSIYEGPLGRAETRGDGAFTLTLTDADGYEDPQALLDALGFSWQLQDGGGYCQCYGDAAGRQTPVFSCLAAVEREGAALTVSGTRLVGAPKALSPEGSPLSLATLLVRFRAGVMESGDACSAILDVSQGYLLSAASGGLQLTPVARVVTDVHTYYVNALTGELTRG